MADDRLMIKLNPELKKQLQALAETNKQKLSEFIRLNLERIAKGESVIQPKPKPKEVVIQNLNLSYNQPMIQALKGSRNSRHQDRFRISGR
jgi:hypothetical protein